MVKDFGKKCLICGEPVVGVGICKTCREEGLKMLESGEVSELWPECKSNTSMAWIFLFTIFSGPLKDKKFRYEEFIEHIRKLLEQNKG